MRFLRSDTDMAPGRTQAPICHAPAKARKRGRNCRRATDPVPTRREGRAAGEIVRGGAHGVGVPRRTAGSGRRRVDSGDQGGGAAVVIDGRGATGAAGFTASSASHPVQRRAVAGGGWPMGVFRIGSAVVCWLRRWLPPGWGGVPVSSARVWNSDLARVPAVATGGQSDPRHPALGEPACGGCLKLKEINHLQHTTGAAHYSALPRSVGPHFSAGFPCIPSPPSRPPRRCNS